MTAAVTFESALALSEPDADGSCHALIGPEWSQGRAAYGGLVAGLMSRALERMLPRERTMRSALIDFVGPVAAGPARIETRVLRVGRALSHAEARVTQHGQVCAILIAAYGESRTTSLHFEGASAPAGPTVDALSTLPYVEGVMPRFTKQFEFRIANGNGLYVGSKRANISGYVRYPGGGPIDAAGVLGRLDSWPPAILPLLTKFAPASTVTWMVDVVGELPARGASSDAFYRYEAEGVAAANGYGSCEARLWAPDGKLVAASRQLVVEFS